MIRKEVIDIIGALKRELKYDEGEEFFLALKNKDGQCLKILDANGVSPEFAEYLKESMNFEGQ